MSTGITETEVDGVATLLAPRAGNRITAGLLFRVGRADETLALAGITHLVEHLALHEHGLSDLHYNGATADTFTHFHVDGTPEEVVRYLNGVCAALRSLPLHRLEVEKEILRTEAAGRSSGPAPSLPIYRYGAQGYGIGAYAEMGLANVDGAKVTDWARTHFTRENAVLWMTTDTVPAGLELDLPSGRRNDCPDGSAIVESFPAWLYGQSDVVYLHAVVERSTTASLFARVLNKALFHDLRQKGGYSYSAQADYWPRDRDHAVIVAMADCLPEKREAVVGAVVDTLARLRFGTITEAELASAKDDARSMFDTPELAAALLPSTAVNLLLSHTSPTVEELLAEIDEVTVGDLRRVAEEVHASLIAQVPALGLDWAGFNALAEYSDAPVRGKEYPAYSAADPKLVVAPEGVSLVTEGGPITVLYRDAVAVQTWPDGGRALIGRDGFRVWVEPTLHRNGAAAVAEVDAAVSADVVVPMPARADDRIPRPQPLAATPPGKRRWGGTLWFWLMVVGTVFFSLSAISATADAIGSSSSDDLGGAIVLWLIVALWASGAWRARTGTRT